MKLCVLLLCSKRGVVGSDMETMSFCLEKDQRIFLMDSYNHDL